MSEYTSSDSRNDKMIEVIREKDKEIERLKKIINDIKEECKVNEFGYINFLWDASKMKKIMER